MTWMTAFTVASAVLLAWLLYVKSRSNRRSREDGPRPVLSSNDRAYEEQERIERAEAERLMREDEERERRGR